MKRFAIAVVVALGVSSIVALPLPLPSLAQQAAKVDEERLKLAQELVRRLIPEENFGRMVHILLRPFEQVLKASNPGKGQQIAALMAYLKRQMLKDKARFLERMAPVYVEVFTAAEMRDILAFLDTPTGRKFIAEQPRLMAMGMRIGQQWGREVSRKLQRELREKAKEHGLKL